jgi:hypothetical protein
MKRGFHIIGITGRARSGKDTIADYVCSEYEYAPLSFAAPLKSMVSALLGEPESWVNEHKDEHIMGLASPRRLLQTLGTEWGRQIIDTNIWVNILSREVSKLDPDWYNGVVIPDVRFNNEAEWILANGGQVWHVERPGALVVAPHISENGVDSRLISWNICNDGTLDDLYEKVEAIL